MCSSSFLTSVSIVAVCIESEDDVRRGGRNKRVKIDLIRKILTKTVVVSLSQGEGKLIAFSAARDRDRWFLQDQIGTRYPVDKDSGQMSGGWRFGGDAFSFFFPIRSFVWSNKSYGNEMNLFSFLLKSDAKEESMKEINPLFHEVSGDFMPNGIPNDHSVQHVTLIVV